MYNVFVSFAEMNKIPDKLGQGVATSAKRLLTTTDTSDDESIGSPRQRNVLSKKN